MAITTTCILFSLKKVGVKLVTTKFYCVQTCNYVLNNKVNDGILNVVSFTEEVKVKVGLSGPPPMKSGFQYVNPGQEDQMVIQIIYGTITIDHYWIDHDSTKQKTKKT